MRRWIDNKDDLHAPTRLQIFEAGYQAASEAERAPDLVIRRLPDWNYAAFLNQTDASCIAIGTTEQEARNNGMRELLKGYAERAAGVRAGLEMAVKWLLYVGGVDHETLLDILRESLAPEDDVDVKAEFTDLQRALIPQPAAPASSGPEWATKVLIDPNASLSEVAEALDALDAVGADAQPTSALPILFDNAKPGQIAVNMPMCDKCEKIFLDCKCSGADAQPTSAAKVVAEQNSAGKWTHWPSGKPAPAPILGEPPTGWKLEDLPAKLCYLADEYEKETSLDCDDLRSAANVIKLAARPPAILGELEGLRDAWLEPTSLHPYRDEKDCARVLDALIKRLGAK